MRTVPAAKVVTAEDAVEEPLSPRVQEALGQLVGGLAKRLAKPRAMRDFGRGTPAELAERGVAL